MHLILEKEDLKESSRNIDETLIELKDFKKNCQDITKQFNKVIFIGNEMENCYSGNCMKYTKLLKKE